MTFPAVALLAKPQPHQTRAQSALDACLRRAGYRTRTTFDLTAPEEVVFCWSWGKAMINRIKHPHAIICCLDHGYTKYRGSFINTGWSIPSMPCGLNGFAEHAWVDDGGARAKHYGLTEELRARRDTPLKRALLLGQVYGDAMVRGHVEDYGKWLRERSQALETEGYRVTFRPHPVMVRRGQSHAYGNLGRVTPHGDLWTDLSQADLAVALSSNGLVAAFLDGIPVDWYSDGSMLTPLELMSHESRFEAREEWLHRLAWAQWTVEELEDGTWLRHHQPIMHRIVETGEVRPWCDRRLL